MYSLAAVVPHGAYSDLSTFPSVLLPPDDEDKDERNGETSG